MVFAGKLSFNPMTDTLIDKDGKPFKFQSPYGDELPRQGFAPGSFNVLILFIKSIKSLIKFNCMFL